MWKGAKSAMSDQSKRETETRLNLAGIPGCSCDRKWYEKQGSSLRPYLGDASIPQIVHKLRGGAAGIAAMAQLTLQAPTPHEDYCAFKPLVRFSSGHIDRPSQSCRMMPPSRDTLGEMLGQGALHLHGPRTSSLYQHQCIELDNKEYMRMLLRGIVLDMRIMNQYTILKWYHAGKSDFSIGCPNSRQRLPNRVEGLYYLGRDKRSLPGRPLARGSSLPHLPGCPI